MNLLAEGYFLWAVGLSPRPFEELQTLSLERKRSLPDMHAKFVYSLSIQMSRYNLLPV